MAIERRIYKNPPIDEALCEFIYVQSGDWDITTPGKFQERVKSRFSGKPLEVPTKIADFVKPQESPSRFRFPKDDDKSFIAIGQNILSVNVFRPYCGWEAFKPEIDFALEQYEKVTTPRKIKRIGVRYINFISIPENEISLNDYFTQDSHVPIGFPEPMMSVFHRIESTYTGENIRLLYSFGSADKVRDDKGKPLPMVSFILDYDLIWEVEEASAVDREDAMEIVEDLRTKEREVFELSITDKTRELFDV